MSGFFGSRLEAGTTGVEYCRNIARAPRHWIRWDAPHLRESPDDVESVNELFHPFLAADAQLRQELGDGHRPNRRVGIHHGLMTQTPQASCVSPPTPHLQGASGGGVVPSRISGLIYPVWGNEIHGPRHVGRYRDFARQAEGIYHIPFDAIRSRSCIRYIITHSFSLFTGPSPVTRHIAWETSVVRIRRLFGRIVRYRRIKVHDIRRGPIRYLLYGQHFAPWAAFRFFRSDGSLF